MYHSSQENEPRLMPWSILFENCNALSILYHREIGIFCFEKTINLNWDLRVRIKRDMPVQLDHLQFIFLLQEHQPWNMRSLFCLMGWRIQTSPDKRQMRPTPVRDCTVKLWKVTWEKLWVVYIHILCWRLPHSTTSILLLCLTFVPIAFKNGKHKNWKTTQKCFCRGVREI